jgi:hypothetical protein
MNPTPLRSDPMYHHDSRLVQRESEHEIILPQTRMRTLCPAIQKVSPSTTRVTRPEKSMSDGSPARTAAGETVARGVHPSSAAMPPAAVMRRTPSNSCPSRAGRRRRRRFISKFTPRRRIIPVPHQERLLSERMAA